MARRLYLLLLALLALGVIGVQLDRQAYRDGQVLHAVPVPFRAVALQRQLEADLGSRQDAPGLLSEARELVRKRPLPARHLLLYAQSAELGGEREQALAALEIAAVRGWREPVPQLAVVQAGLVSGDYAAVAQRLAALVATGAAAEQTNALLGEMMAEAEGREALADLLAGEGTWKRHFVTALRAGGDSDDLAATIALAWARGATLSCDQLRPAALTYLRAGRPDLADSIWQGDCARERLALD